MDALKTGNFQISTTVSGAKLQQRCPSQSLRPGQPVDQALLAPLAVRQENYKQAAAKFNEALKSLPAETRGQLAQNMEFYKKEFGSWGPGAVMDAFLGDAKGLSYPQEHQWAAHNMSEANRALHCQARPTPV
ncbi:hypothetical protein JST97_35475 [bacterium]|nr:hypothetical protein [bacterium]